MTDSPLSLLELRLIQRKRVQQSLAIAAIAALLLSSCSEPSPEEIANQPVEAFFYETPQQCEADIKRQQQTYQAQLAAHKQGNTTQKLVPPVMTVEDCAPQMMAARQEYEKTAPLYANAQDCQAEGVRCEAVSGTSGLGYRPVYGGSYLHPYGTPSYRSIPYGGTQRRVYEPHPVYASNTAGQVVTPFGQTVAKTTPGRVSAPRHTSLQAPQRPAGRAARGTISGRSRQGFGSSFRSTGRGGK